MKLVEKSVFLNEFAHENEVIGGNSAVVVEVTSLPVVEVVPCTEEVAFKHYEVSNTETAVIVDVSHYCFNIIGVSGFEYEFLRDIAVILVLGYSAC